MVEIPDVEDNFPIAFEAGQMFAHAVWQKSEKKETRSPLDIAVACASSG